MRYLLDDIPGKRRIRAGMVGGGKGSFFAAIHRAAMRLSNRFDIVEGAFSSNSEVGAEAGKALGVAPDRIYADFREMAAAEANRADPIHVAIVVTPNHLHFEPCRLFLEAGIPVICDKPLVNRSDEARELMRIAAQRNTFFAVTYAYTGYPMVRDARARVQRGELGDIRFLYVEYLLEWLADDPSKLGKGGVWRGDPAKAGLTGALGDIGTHAFNILEYVSDSAARSCMRNSSRARTVSASTIPISCRWNSTAALMESCGRDWLRRDIAMAFASRSSGRKPRWNGARRLPRHCMFPASVRPS